MNSLFCVAKETMMPMADQIVQQKTMVKRKNDLAWRVGVLNDLARVLQAA